MTQPQPTGGNTLIWRVKDSFVRYIEHLEDGKVELTENATEGPTGFHFPGGDEPQNFDIETLTGTLAFGGNVIFTGYWGGLRLEITHPQVQLKAGSGQLSIRTGGVVGSPRWEAIADADATTAANGDLALSLRLTAAGRMLLGQQYQVGQELDPAHISFRTIGK